MNSAGRLLLLLLFWKNGIFHSLANAKFQRGFGRNLNRFARRGVSAFTGFSLGFYELSESGENKLTIGFHFAGSETAQLFEKLLYLGSLHSCGFREVVNNFRLGHALLACSGFGRHSLV
jgi:hypothetical protein